MSTTTVQRGQTWAHIVARCILFPLFIPFFIGMAIYELVMLAIGKHTYSKPQCERAFEHGYNPPVYEQETAAKHPDIWAYAAEKTYQELAGDLRLVTLMGIIYRFRDPQTTEEFDALLSRHMQSFRRQADSPQSAAAMRLWNPANVIRFLDAYYRTRDLGNFRHYYVHDKGSTDAWRIFKLGTEDIKPRNQTRSVKYYCEYTTDVPGLWVNYSFSGDQASISHVRFYKSADADQIKRTISTLCNFVIELISATFDKSEATAVLARLNVSEPQPFECVLPSARIKLGWDISRPYWSEPDQGLAYITIEKVQAP